MGFYADMASCTACRMRSTCTQVVLPDGNRKNPILMIIGEAPIKQDDEEGIPFIGDSGMVLRETLRHTKVLNKTNTVITNVLKCRHPDKFPKDESASICVSTWLMKEIEFLKPQVILLLGSVPLKYVANLKGITENRGSWLDVKGIKTLATYHPSYILRMDGQGDLSYRKTFEQDIFQVAGEVATILKSMPQELK